MPRWNLVREQLQLAPSSYIIPKGIWCGQRGARSQNIQLGRISLHTTHNIGNHVEKQILSAYKTVRA